MGSRSFQDKGEKTQRNFNSQEPMEFHSATWAWCMLGKVSRLPPCFIVTATPDR